MVSYIRPVFVLQITSEARIEMRKVDDDKLRGKNFMKDRGYDCRKRIE